MAYTGKFKIRCGKHGRHQVVLNRGDFIVAPAGLKRCFECVEEENLAWCPVMGQNCSKIFTVVPGPPWVQWAQETVTRAIKMGVDCDEFGRLGAAKDAPKSDTAAKTTPTSRAEMIEELDCEE